MRILVADDEHDLLDVTIKRLKADGFSVDGCFSEFFKERKKLYKHREKLQNMIWLFLI